MNTTVPPARPANSSKQPVENETSAGNVVWDALRTLVEKLRAAEPQVRHGNAQAVSQMRVTARQLRSLLRGFSRIFDPHATRPVVAELAWLGRQLGEENDTHASKEELRRLFDTLPPELIVGCAVTDVEEEMGRLTAQAARTTLAALDSRRYAAIRKGVERLAVDPPFSPRADRPAGMELSKSVVKAMRRLDDRLAAARVPPPGPQRDAALHEARKADKHLRYVTEVAAPTIGKPAHRLARQAKKLQNLLGDYQDAVVTLLVLRRLANTAAAKGEPVTTYRLLEALERARIEQVLRELPHRLERLHDEQVAWLPEFRSMHLRLTAAAPTHLPPSAVWSATPPGFHRIRTPIETVPTRLACPVLYRCRGLRPPTADEAPSPGLCLRAPAERTDCQPGKGPCVPPGAEHPRVDDEIGDTGPVAASDLALDHQESS
jgi:CHAD domain-containing protein